MLSTCHNNAQSLASSSWHQPCGNNQLSVLFRNRGSSLGSTTAVNFSLNLSKIAGVTQPSPPCPPLLLLLLHLQQQQQHPQACTGTSCSPTTSRLFSIRLSFSSPLRFFHMRPPPSTTNQRPFVAVPCLNRPPISIAATHLTVSG
jgi:hypothetical protein